MSHSSSPGTPVAPEPFFLDTPAGALYAVRHRPQGPPARAVLVLPPLFEEKKPSYRVLYDLACRLTDDGAAVLRFDYHGTGDSTGRHADLTSATMREDAAAAAADLRERAPDVPLVLLGLRIGAALALDEARRLRAAAVVALAPIIKGKRFVSEVVRKKQVRSMMTAGQSGAVARDVAEARKHEAPVDLDGFETSSRLLADLEGMNFLDAPPPAAARTLLVDVGVKEAPSADSAALAAALGAGAEARALKAPSFWNLTDAVRIPKLETLVADWVSLSGHHE